MLLLIYDMFGKENQNQSLIPTPIYYNITNTISIHIIIILI